MTNFIQPLYQVKALESLGDRWFTPVVVWLFVFWKFMIPNKSCQSPSSPTMTTFSIQWWVKLWEGFNNTHALVWFSTAVTSIVTTAACAGKAFFSYTSRSQSIAEESWRKNSGQEPGAETQRNRNRLLPCSLVHAQLVFLHNPGRPAQE